MHREREEHKRRDLNIKYLPICGGSSYSPAIEVYTT